MMQFLGITKFRNINMKKSLLMLFGLMASYSVFAENSELPDIKEGLWALTSTAEMSGMPMEMPPMTTTSEQCMSKKNALDPRTMLKNQNCEITNMVIDSNTAKWEMSCSQQGMEMTGNGSINYQYESMSGTFNMNMQSEAGTMKIVTEMTGRYLGACK